MAEEYNDLVEQLFRIAAELELDGYMYPEIADAFYEVSREYESDL
ncbi:hypothetical protein M1M34_gp044 [Haloarcula tailed virus 2]|uniref:Uncharacterized protein n=1 Tax=Haloarcula tailed virus 2 TaxID=2877989 RepID=A0AAE8XZV4_9CAUD|nr:hypothetical protein M1M34_gp044 [Haloarcula tailed virus 2]UBF23195.1 hypothetical protein HATV-2_gp44 [Haloarcula tailed virus 2]